MAKTKKTPDNDEVSLEVLRKKLKRSNKIITKDGKVKKKILKQFTLYQCNVCNKKFTDKYNLTTHEKLHLNEEFPCTNCSYVGKTKKYLARHKRSAHSTPRHECGVCGRAFHHPSGLKEHAMVHTGEKPLKCEVCGKTFRVSYSLNTHMLIHKNEKPFKCSFCTYACRDTSTLRKHEHRHMGIVRTFPCKICRKKFDSKPKLKYHISEIHLDYLELDLKKYTCDHCGKNFKIKSNMMKHVEIVHEKSAPCPCPLCGRRLKHERYLTRHLRTHFPERPHVCAHAGCGKAFKDKGDLKKHSMIHTVHLQAACAQCGATFARAYRLAAHMRTHEPREKKVTCDYCQLKFYTKNYLIKHIKQKHSVNRQRYVCDECGLVTFNKPSIVMHLKYGRCRNDELCCKICKTTYKHLAYLRSHYLKTHKMRYKPMKRKMKKEKKPSIEIKVEPMDDPYEDVQLSLLEVSKEEIEVEEEGNVENDLVTYSKHVLSEDLQYLLNDDTNEDKPEDSFDDFLLKHVFHKQVKDEEDPEPKIEKTDEQQAALVAQKIKEVILKAKQDDAKKLLERKKKRQAKLLEKKLRREAKMMRRKKRRERFELERVRQIYNERMKKAAAEASKKEPAWKIKYFQQKTCEEDNTEKVTEKTTDNYHKGSSIDIDDCLVDHNRNKDLNSNDNSINVIIDNTSEIKITLSANNTEKDINVTNELIDLSNNNYNVSHTAENDNTKAGNIENELKNDKNMNTNDRGSNTSEKEKGANSKLNFTSDEDNCTNYKNTYTNDKHNLTDVKDKDSNDNQNCKSDVNNGTNYKHNCTSDVDRDTNDKQNCTNDEDKVANDKQNCTSLLNKGTNDKQDITSNVVINDGGNGTNDNEKDSTLNDDDDDDSDDEKPDSDSNYEPNSEDESAPNKKMNFKTYQCYICFKLYPTKEELMSHCESHFDICNSTTLSKCPACGHVVSRNIAKHMRIKHDIHVNIPHSKISRRDDEQGSKYCYKMADTVMEIIPSVKMLNHTAAIEIDKRNRERRDKTVAKTRLVKKGTEWIVENYAANISYQEMPEFTEQELSKLPVSGNYIERLGELGRLARSKGVKILFPCQACDKICQNYCALKLHGRRHDPNKKPFARRQNKRNQTTANDKPKVINIENRSAKPQPIKNKHKCDEKLKKFYETHIRGADIEFWQFLKIYNKMDRENIKDFTDLENRTDFGMYKNIDSTNAEAGEPKSGKSSSKTAQQSAKRKTKDTNLRRKEIAGKLQFFSSKSIHKIDRKISKTPSKLVQQNITKKPLYKRVIMISKKQHLEREKAKMLLRQKLGRK